MRLFLSRVKNPREEYVILMLAVRVWESCGSLEGLQTLYHLSSQTFMEC